MNIIAIIQGLAFVWPNPIPWAKEENMDKKNKTKQAIPDWFKKETRDEAEYLFRGLAIGTHYLSSNHLRQGLEELFILSSEQGYEQGYKIGDKEGYARGLADGSAKIFPVG
jgi:flagellar biosynthesis/type III secretory pathway protein FliH